MSAGKPDVKTSGPWRGMRYAFDPEKPAPQDLLYWAQNMMPLTRPGPYVRRRRDRYYDVTPNNHFALWAHTWRKQDGTTRSLIAVADGSDTQHDLYELVPFGASIAFNIVLSAATLTAAGVTFRGGEPVDFLGNLIFGSNGIGGHKPFMWDGTLNGGITVLNNCSDGARSPAVYYGKLFFVKSTVASDQSTIIWSEENQPNTGYEAGGFLNVWPLTQQGQDAIRALVGTNEGLYYFRASSIGAIRGAVTPDFVAAGVHDNISTLIGTISRPAFINDRLWFTDKAGRPWMRTPSGELTPIWEHAPLIWPSTGDTQTNGAGLGWCYVNDHSAVLLLARTPSGLTLGFAFDAADGTLLGVWTWSQPPVFLGQLVTPQLVLDVPVVLVNGNAGSPLRAGFYCDPDYPPDNYVAENPAQTYRLLTHPLGALDGSLRHWTELDIEFWLDGNAAASPDNVPAVVSAAEKVYQQGLVDPLAALAGQQLSHAVQPQSQRRVWGLNRELRWGQAGVAVSAALALKAWGVNRVTLKGVAIPIPPSRS